MTQQAGTKGGGGARAVQSLRSYKFDCLHDILATNFRSITQHESSHELCLNDPLSSDCSAETCAVVEERERRLPVSEALYRLKLTVHGAMCPENSQQLRPSCSKTTNFHSLGGNKNRSFCRPNGTTAANTQGNRTMYSGLQRRNDLDNCQAGSLSPRDKAAGEARSCKPANQVPSSGYSG